ncbi:MAG: D-ribose pyranase [Planifilum fimeticola]
MKKTTLLNSHLSRVISEMGHTDRLVVADAGLPIPRETERIDLAVRPGLPGFLETLEAILSELEVEKVYVAEETGRISPQLHRALKEMFPEAEWEAVTHEELKGMTKGAKAVVRTGECTPYANVILQAGVSF